MKEIKEFYDKLLGINYGWYDKRGNLYKGLNKEYNFLSNYRMQPADNILKNNYSICWDLCELEREFFKKNKYKYMTIMAVLNDKFKMPNHTFLVFKLNEKYYWFESSWKEMRGIKEYNSLKDIFEDIKDNFKEFTKTDDYDKDKIEFYSYRKVRKNIGCQVLFSLYEVWKEN